MTTPFKRTFKHDHEMLLQHLRLKGLQPKTIDAYSRGMRRIGLYFDLQVYDLSEQQLIDYFSTLLTTPGFSSPCSCRHTCRSHRCSKKTLANQKKPKQRQQRLSF